MKIRLNKVQKELNLGLSTIVEFLQKNNFEIEENPNAVVPEEGYNLLIKEFSTDKNLRIQSDKFTQERQNKEKALRLLRSKLYDMEMQEQRDKIADLIRRVQPDFIITHGPNDYMPDHNAVSRLVFDASFTATLPNYPTKTGKAARLVPIYYMDTLAGVNFNPTEYVDVSEYIDKKLEMLECHESQIVWMRDHDHIDFPDMVKTCCRYRGYQCGVAYAEGFRAYNVYPRHSTKHLLP